MKIFKISTNEVMDCIYYNGKNVDKCIEFAPTVFKKLKIPYSGEIDEQLVIQSNGILSVVSPRTYIVKSKINNEIEMYDVKSFHLKFIIPQNWILNNNADITYALIDDILKMLNAKTQYEIDKYQALYWNGNNFEDFVNWLGHDNVHLTTETTKFGTNNRIEILDKRDKLYKFDGCSWIVINEDFTKVEFYSYEYFHKVFIRYLNIQEIVERLVQNTTYKELNSTIDDIVSNIDLIQQLKTTLYGAVFKDIDSYISDIYAVINRMISNKLDDIIDELENIKLEVNK